jgi:uncharacterized protein YraI
MSYSRFARLTVCFAITLLALGAAGCSAPAPVPTQAPIPSDTPAAVASPAQPTAPATATVPPTSTPTIPPSTPTVISATPTVTTTAAFTATIKGTATIRSGPGTGYAFLGTLAPGLTIRVTGRNAAKSWLQIDFPASPTGSGWVPAANTNAGTKADALAVINVPPAPTRAATPSRTVPTVTAAANVLRADKDTLAPDECTTLRWDIDNFKELYLNLGSEEVPVSGHEARQVCLDSTVTYVLRVVSANGTTQRYSVTVTVSEDCTDKQTEITRLEVSATKIKAGQSATISWDVTCAQGVYFKEGTGESVPRQQVLRHDTVEVQPGKSTTYRLIVIAKDGSEIRRDVRIEVEP